MKILITDIHHGNGGGHVTYVLSLLEGLKHRCDLTLAVPPTGRLFQRASAIEGVRVVPGLYTSRPLPLMAEVLRLRRFLAQENFDVVHVNGGADHRHMMLARMGMRRKPAIVWTKHNTNSVSSLGHRLRARFGTEAVIAVCEFVKRQLATSAYANKPTRVVRLGINPALIGAATTEQRNKNRRALFGALPADAVVFGSIGGTDYNKGWLLLVQAIATLSESTRQRVRVVIAGDPPSEQMLADVRAAGLDERQIVFPGLVADVRTILAACDVGFVLSYREAASYASCETMAMGLPTLVSDAGGLPENVRNGIDGWVVPEGDVDSLAARVAAIVEESPETMVAMGVSARQRIKSVFSIPAFLDHTLNVYALASQRAGYKPSRVAEQSSR